MTQAEAIRVQGHAMGQARMLAVHAIIALELTERDARVATEGWDFLSPERRLAEVTLRLKMLASRARDVLAALDHANRIGG